MKRGNNLSIKRMLERLGRESGVSLMETLLALALLGTVGVTFLSGLATMSKATMIHDERSVGESLARSQMETAKGTGYVYEAGSYTPAAIPAGKDYTGYSANVTAQPLHNPDEGIQKITVSVNHFSKEVVRLEGYKVDR